MAKKKVVIDEESCIGCATCQGISDGNDGGYFIVEDVAKVAKSYDEEDKDVLEEAISSCPVSAISISEE